MDETNIKQMKNYQKWLAMLIFIAGLVMMSISHVQQGKRIEALTPEQAAAKNSGANKQAEGASK